MSFRALIISGVVLCIICLFRTTVSLPQGNARPKTNSESLHSDEKQLSTCNFELKCYPLSKDDYLTVVKICEEYLFIKNCCCNVEVLSCQKVCAMPCEICSSSHLLTHTSPNPSSPPPSPTSTPTSSYPSSPTSPPPSTPPPSPTSTPTGPYPTTPPPTSFPQCVSTKCTPPSQSPPWRKGWIGGDPHITTYDGLDYDCDGCGEFIASRKNECPRYEIQSRFYIPTPSAGYSLMSDVVIVHESTPTIQVSLVQSTAVPNASYLGGTCKITFYINGIVNVLGHPATGSDFGFPSSLSVDTTSNGITIKLLQSGIQVHIWFWKFLDYCAWGMQHLLPPTISHSNILGLLGTPDSKIKNDLTDSCGNVIFIPSPPVSPTDGTEYCTTYWRLRFASQSHFTYEPGTSFDSIKNCPEWPEDSPSVDDEDVRQAMISPSVDKVCGESPECRKEYQYGGEEAAVAYENALQKANENFIRAQG